MAKLPEYTTFDDKQPLFSKMFFKIHTKKMFDEWYNNMVTDNTHQQRTTKIFRGMKEAKYKLFTSAQRLWIQNDMVEWAKTDYIGFINNMVQNAKHYSLIKKVFDTYNYTDEEREFPILSILQHYGGPTPLMDLSYNVNVALYFATENLTVGNGKDTLDNYFSIYLIYKPNVRNEFVNMTDWFRTIFELAGKTTYPGINLFKDWGDDPMNPNKNGIVYISDLDDGNSNGSTDSNEIKINAKFAHKPLTAIYNQNIIPQEGLFIFNPLSTKPIEEIFNVPRGSDGSNLWLNKFMCFNIKKDLADYIKRKIKVKEDIDESFIKPHLYNDVEKIKNITLNEYAKK